MSKEKLIEVKDLTIEFNKNKQPFDAVNDVTFDIYKGETFGLVGESGSGKTTTGRSIIGIQPISNGTVYFNNHLIRGKTPNLKSETKKINNYLKSMAQNEKETAKIMNNYLNDFKSTYKKVSSQNYTEKELIEARDETLKSMSKVEAKIKANLIFLIKTIKGLDEIKRTIEKLQEDETLDQTIINNYFDSISKMYDFVLLVKKTQNTVDEELETINRINTSNGKDSMDKIAVQLKDMVSNHKLITRILTSLNDDYIELEKLPGIDLEIKKSKMFKKLDKKANHDLKQKMQMIFQDPASSLNSRMNVQQIIGEGLDNFPELYKNDEAVDSYLKVVNKNRDKPLTKDEVKYSDVKRFLIEQMLTAVGMLPEHLNRYPHEFSGGQKQRIGIARSLIMKPEFIIADEPISSLDVSIRAQIINLLLKFQKEYGLTYLFIAHDLTVVRFIADRIGVIYHGRLVELANSEELFKHPLHPYTKTLLKAIPIPNPDKVNTEVVKKYNASEEHYDYLTDFPMWTEVTPGHFAYLNNRELKEATKKHK